MGKLSKRQKEFLEEIINVSRELIADRTVPETAKFNLRLIRNLARSVINLNPHSGALFEVRDMGELLLITPKAKNIPRELLLPLRAALEERGSE